MTVPWPGAMKRVPIGSFSLVLVYERGWSFGAVTVDDDSRDSDRILGDVLG